MTGIVAHTYPEWWLKLTGQVAHWSTDYSKYDRSGAKSVGTASDWTSTDCHSIDELSKFISNNK